MDFNSNREELLKVLRSQKKKRPSRSGNPTVSSHSSHTIKPVRSTTEVLIYGHSGPFLRTLRSVVENVCRVQIFEDIDKAAEYVIQHHIPVVLMDLDPPSDWKMCHDLFTTGKTMYPDIHYIVYQSQKKVPDHIRMLEKQGAHIFSKPVETQELRTFIRTILEDA
jgi:DNA-binding NtrC family response regulator